MGQSTTPARSVLIVSEPSNKGSLIVPQPRKGGVSQRCRLSALVMALEADVTSWDYTRGLYGRAFIRRKHIRAPESTTERRLYIWAHECGHVKLNHIGRKKPRQREEYEAEQYAISTLKRHGFTVPEESLIQAKEYVARKIQQAVVRGARTIDDEALRWVRPLLPMSIIERL
jgi:hypothetical protein